jgi:hypothetical protein
MILAALPALLAIVCSPEVVLRWCCGGAEVVAEVVLKGMLSKSAITQELDPRQVSWGLKWGE